MMELIRAGNFSVAEFGGEAVIMGMVKDITEVIVDVAVRGSVGCAVVMGMMSCMI